LDLGDAILQRYGEPADSGFRPGKSPLLWRNRFKTSRTRSETAPPRGRYVAATLLLSYLLENIERK